MKVFSRRRLGAAAATAALLGVLVPVATATAASAYTRPGTITAVNVPAYGGWDYTGIYLSRGEVVLSASGTIYSNGSLYGPAGGGTCTGALVPYLPCNALVGEIGSGPYFEVPNTSYLRVYSSGELYLGVNTPTGASTGGFFRVSVVGLP